MTVCVFIFPSCLRAQGFVTQVLGLILRGAKRDSTKVFNS